jgi:hypothetical protein
LSKQDDANKPKLSRRYRAAAILVISRKNRIGACNLITIHSLFSCYLFKIIENDRGEFLRKY